MRPCHTNLVLDTMRRSFSSPLFRKGVELSLDDNQTVMEVYQQWLLLLLDLGYLHPETLKRDGQRLWSEMIKVDVLDLNNAMAECLGLIRLQTSKGFKGLCANISTHLYSLLRDDLQLMIRGDVFAAKRLVQVFAFTSRMSLKDIDLTQQMLESYMDTELNIPNEFPMPLVWRLNKIIRRWVKDFDPARIKPRHGKGAVAFMGRASLEDKYKALSSDQMLRYAFGEDTWSCSLVAPKLERVSQTMFVPKSYKTFRTISMEPPTLMYFQQGVWHEIDRIVLRNPYLRNHISFHDQERNRSLAMRGSIERSYATIDLSSASDSVSYELVKQLFRGTRLLRFVVSTRSRETMLPDGRLIRLRKFAPMGSALCFPIETMIFAAICELVTRELRVAGDYSVYGDDIIVPTQCAERTMEVLERVGFHVNREKSFYHANCWFRESCGGEFCDGYDVTPMRITRKYTHREQDVRLEALVDSANRAYMYGFRHLRSFYLRKMREYGFIPLFSPSSVLADNYTNYHTRRRWNRNWQCIQVRVTDPSDRYRVQDLDSQDETLRYRHWLESTIDREIVDEAFISIICKPTKSLKNTWTNKPYEPSDQGLIDLYLGRGKFTRPL